MGHFSKKGDDRIWNEALDWLFRVNAQPDDQSTQAALIAWLATSDAHAAAFSEAKNVWHLIGQVLLLDASTLSFTMETRGPNENDLVQSAPHVGERVDSSSQVPGRIRLRSQGRNAGGRRTKRVVAACGIGTLAAFLAFFFLPTFLLRLTADYVTKVGETQLVQLDDGTSVYLNTDSALRVSYTPEQRQVELLAGEAFFKVTPDPDRAFLVRADRGVVRVLGSAFQVRLDHPTMSVAVQSGEVSVSRDLPAAAEKSSLRKGQTLQLNLATGATQLQQVVPDQIAAWRDNQLIVEQWTVNEAINEIARYYRGIILLTDDTLAKQPISGVYDLHDPVAAVKAVVQPYAATVWEVTPYILIVSA